MIIEVDGKNVLVSREASFDITTFYDATESHLSVDETHVSWVNGKPDAVTEELAEWMEEAGINLKKQGIDVVSID